VGRGLLGCASALALGGCVGQNPFWDPPSDGSGDSAGDDAVDDTSVGGRGGETGDSPTTVADTSTGGTTTIAASDGESTDGGNATSTGSSADGTETSGGPVDSGGPMDSGGPTDGGSSSDGGSSCEPPNAMCDGECFDVRSDHHHCGVECIDCMEVYGPSTHCVDGMCDVDEDDD
jgi:hypothetical protein